MAEKERSAAHVSRITRRGLHAVGGVVGLYLQVTPTGSRSWILRAVVGSKRRDIGLGSYPTCSLSEARERARAARKLIWSGIDPVADRAAKKAALVSVQSTPTFDECARRFLSGKTAEFRNQKHIAQWSSTIATYASPVFGDKPVDAIGLQEILRALEPIWTTKPETASRVRGRIESILAWATVAQHRHGDNPARWRGNLDAVLPKPGKLRATQHFAALPFADVPAFLVALRQQAGTAARALELAILTACRSGEVRGATWQEIDLGAGIWTIPSERMKAGKQHRIPLSRSAVALLERQPRMGELVFPTLRGGQTSDMVFSALLKRMGIAATAHGFRSSFRDWAGEVSNFPREVAEHALAHQLRDQAEAAYARGTLFDKRRKLMEAWATFCNTPRPTANVLPIRRSKTHA